MSQKEKVVNSKQLLGSDKQYEAGVVVGGGANPAIAHTKGKYADARTQADLTTKNASR